MGSVGRFCFGGSVGRNCSFLFNFQFFNLISILFFAAAHGSIDRRYSYMILQSTVLPDFVLVVQLVEIVPFYLIFNFLI